MFLYLIPFLPALIELIKLSKLPTNFSLSSSADVISFNFCTTLVVFSLPASFTILSANFFLLCLPTGVTSNSAERIKFSSSSFNFSISTFLPESFALVNLRYFAVLNNES